MFICHISVSCCLYSMAISLMLLLIWNSIGVEVSSKPLHHSVNIRAIFSSIVFHNVDEFINICGKISVQFQKIIQLVRLSSWWHIKILRRVILRTKKHLEHLICEQSNKKNGIILMSKSQKEKNHRHCQNFDMKRCF